MTRDEKYNIRKHMKLRAVLESIGEAVLRNKADTVPKLVLVGFYLVGALYVWSMSRSLSALADSIELVSPIMEYAMRHSVRMYLTVGCILLLALAFYPLGEEVDGGLAEIHPVSSTRRGCLQRCCERKPTWRTAMSRPGRSATTVFH